MTEFTFTKSRIDHHEESIGVDMRPQIDLNLDRQRVQQFYNLANERFGSVFENLDQRPNDFRICRNVPVPGKGQISVQTFVLTPRGPSFNFPRNVMGIDEFPWPSSANDLVLECLDILAAQFPTHRFVRIGKVRNIVFATGDADSGEIIRSRFCTGIPDGVRDVVVGWSRVDEGYNIKLNIAGAEQRSLERTSGRVIPKPTGQFGIKILLDVNNRQMDRPLSCDDMRLILKKADAVYENELLSTLNGE